MGNRFWISSYEIGEDILYAQGDSRSLSQVNPKIIFFDEPTTGLDVAKSNEIYRVFFRSHAKLGYTAVIVSHDFPRILKLADYVALLHNGVIQDMLTPEAFQLSNNPVIRDYVKETMGTLYSSESMEA